MYKKGVQMPPFAQPNVCAKFQEFLSMLMAPKATGNVKKNFINYFLWLLI